MDPTCYWRHEAAPGAHYTCLDGKSRVCARCCVEECAVETPAWCARCASAGHPTWPAVAGRRALPAKLVCLESYWDAKLFHEVSVKGFFDALRPLLTPPLQVAHRFVESRRGVAYYVRYPDGLLWKEPDAWNAPVYYLAFHGRPAGVTSVLDAIGAKTLCDAFRDYGSSGYDNLVYFGACSVLRGRKGRTFARSFLRASGCRAVVGYTTSVNWMTGVAADLLFLHRFYSHPDPWNNLRALFASVQEDFRPARDLGHTLVLAEEEFGDSCAPRD